MKRRKALTLTASIFGTGIIGSAYFLASCKPKEEARVIFSDKDLAFLDEVGETILPTSDLSPGAKAANIGEFMKKIIADCYSKDESEIFYNGISQIEAKAFERFSTSFMSLSSEDRQNVLSEYDKAAKNQKDEPHFFRMMKELTLWGFFSSEVGATQALRYNPVPGRFDGCIDYHGEPAWV